MFSAVDYTSSKEYVVFTLSDGTQLQLPTWSAFVTLRLLCNEMNTNISSLQTLVTALQENDYIKSVAPLMQGGKEVGYTITFGKSNPITIYHGKDGQNGNDGKDGSTPVIGVKQDTDGIYYWTLDGEWLTDGGNKIKAQGTDGQDGNNGQDGTNGKDGITPKLKIENGYWHISYDNESSWTQLGKATGEDGKDGQDGKPGTDGKDGDSMFSSVTQDDDNVYFTLVDKTVITITKHKNLTITFSQQNDITILLGQSATISYTLTGVETMPSIEMIVPDGWEALVSPQTISSGSITITHLKEVSNNNKIVVFVSDGRGKTTMATLTLVSTNFIYIPDATFKQYLVANFDKNYDGEISIQEAHSVTHISCFGLTGISSVEGIEYFTALTNFNCTQTNIQILDVSKNRVLTDLICTKTNISHLDLSKNIALTHLECGYNNLSTLDLSNNTALTHLSCNNNNISTLYINNNTELTSLNCKDNNLRNLDLNNNTKLIQITCSGNSLTTLDVSKTNLPNSTSPLPPLNCSNMPSLKTLYLKKGWTIEGINDSNRTSQYIPDQTRILYKD